MSTGSLKRTATAGLLAGIAITFAAGNALAVPSYSRQTGLSCDTCHTVPPQLTPFGRYFKMNGYVLSTKNLAPQSPGKTPKESIGQFPPISAMIKISDTILNKAEPGTQNGSIALPQALSLYYAGRIAPHMGSFIQMTYDAESDHFGLDMADIRYANTINIGKSSMVWGISLNNMPTFEDPWNSTPSEGFPFTASDSAPGPDAAPVVMTLAGNVAGLSAYAWFNNSLYGDVGVYRTSELGVSQPLDSSATDVISGAAPYWRLAWEHDWSTSGNYTHSWEIGTYGMSAHLFPGGGQPLAGATDNYLDTAIDSQYQLIFPDHSSLAVHAAYIHEKQTLDASAPTQPDNHLNTFTVDAQYYWNGRYGPSVGYFNTTGNANPVVYGSRTAKPDSSGWIMQWTYLPAQNVQLGVQYTIYNKFNGSSSNYDGTGRNASDNDALYLFAWILF